MIDSVIINIIKLFDFIIIFSILIILIGFILKFLFRKISFVSKKTKIYGIFLHLDNLSIVALSSALIKYIFILWCMTRSNEINTIHLVTLILLSLIYNLTLLKYNGIILDIINSIFEYIALFCLSLLFAYLGDIRFIWYIFAIAILLALFITAYATYFFLRNIYDIGQKSKYSRRE